MLRLPFGITLHCVLVRLLTEVVVWFWLCVYKQYVGSRKTFLIHTVRQCEFGTTVEPPIMNTRKSGQPPYNGQTVRPLPTHCPYISTSEEGTTSEQWIKWSSPMCLLFRGSTVICLRVWGVGEDLGWPFPAASLSQAVGSEEAKKT